MHFKIKQKNCQVKGENMKYFYRVFLWENGGKSVDYTEYLLMPVFIEDHLDETLDEGEIMLDSMPISSKNAFPPKTKFRIERYTSSDFSGEPKTFDMVVEHDDVEEYAGCPNICCHRIYLQEVSVIAQGMHIDNVALTYELQDVALNYKTIRDDTTPIGDSCKAIPGGYQQAIRQTDNIGYSQAGEQRYFRNSYRYVWDDSSLNSIRALKLNLSATQVNSISFTVPRLYCEGCYNPGIWSNLFEMNTITRVYKVKTLNGQEIGNRELIAEKVCGATSLPNVNDTVFYANGLIAQLRAVQDWTDEGNVYVNEFDRRWTTHPTIATANSSYSNKTIYFLTSQLSDSEILQGYNLSYIITCNANPTNQNGMIENYEKKFYGLSYPYFIPPDIITYLSRGSATTTINSITQSSSVGVNASFICADMTVNAEGGPFLMKGVKYSCFDLLRKALLTIDTQILDNSQIGLDSILDETFNEIGIQYPIIISPEWNNRLKTMKVQETIFEGKNLWEVLLQIGYYLHAIPYLEFASDETDRFMLKFRQLGDTKQKVDTSRKITIFNSKNLSEYFTQYDSYVTNMFSPQNVVDEWLVTKMSNPNFLVSNNTAELQTSFPILEILDFEITYDGSVGGTPGTQNALQNIFEESVYQILTSDNPIKISPAKGNSIYYTLGDNIIKGLNYIPPTVNNDGKMALKEICRRLFGVGNSFIPANLQFSSLKFHIKYRTQDSLRISQIRPDIQNFMKNSSYEKYPHHEQWFGQQDKIVDSERFSANLFGKLIRVGNNVYQCQEYAVVGNEKESGDLVIINNDAYYVIETENEYYPDAIFQKVTYSKNFNQLSNVVTIPSEPRFYEISERSKIRREVRIMEFFELSTIKNTVASAPRFLNNNEWKNFLKYLIFNSGNISIPNFAYTKFVADYKRIHTGNYGQLVEPTNLFPSCEINRADPNNITPVAPSDHADCIVPLLHFPLHDGIVFEWNMEDNFKTGDYVDSTLDGGTGDDKYLTLQPLRYVDVMGRADLFTFKLFNKTNWSYSQTQQLPKAVFVPTDNESQVYLPSPYLIGLDKDCREELSFNYQINLLHRSSISDDDFITFPNLFGEKESTLKMCFLDEAQSLFNENLNLSSAHIVADNVQYQLLDDSLNSIEIRIPNPNVDLTNVKSIVLYQEDSIGGKYAYIVKNVGKLTNNEKLKSWWIYPVFNS